jgi:hypothetical protein
MIARATDDALGNQSIDRGHMVKLLADSGSRPTTTFSASQAVLTRAVGKVGTSRDELSPVPVLTDPLGRGENMGV